MNPSWDLLPINQLIRILARKTGQAETSYLGWNREQLKQKIDALEMDNEITVRRIDEVDPKIVEKLREELRSELIEKIKDESWIEHSHIRTQFGHLRKEIVDAIASTRQVRTNTIIIDKRTDPEGIRDLGRQHVDFATLLSLLPNNVFLVGPAGSGKTLAAMMAAKARGLPFYFNGAIDSEYKLLGFIDAQGRVIHPAFRKAFTTGGVYLFDEVDASLPSAVLAFNAALSNDMCDFPDGCMPRHPDFVCLAAGNTFYGADHAYVGRMKQDAAFLDRFLVLDWHYDTELERDLGLDLWPDNAQRALSWFKMVLKTREQAALKGLQVVISPRATLGGIKLLRQNVPWTTAVRVTLRKTMKLSDWDKIMEFTEEPARPVPVPDRGLGYGEFEDDWNDRHPKPPEPKAPEEHPYTFQVKSHGKSHRKFYNDLL
jgi:cobaltochelatase CobS